ncbi:MAG: SGNH/GDSL hydrolase family protein [Sphingobacteriales bacterium]|nr:SGNH/GDSL hydrolase family protein [Sphingobacteriales bacterium]MBI3720821.1 SGNH/GDSL hydrolase family protein [Sphingobacteriales bacterium]
MKQIKIYMPCLLIVLLLLAGCMKKKRKIIFFGDSITQYGVLPGGYIDQLNKKLENSDQQDEYELTGAGISGNKVSDLYQRLNEDVLKQKPDIVVIWVGVNDILYKAIGIGGTDADKFEELYAEIINKLQAEHIKVVLVTPAVIGEKYNNTNQQDNDLNLYSEIVRKLSKRYRCTLCDARTIFLNNEKLNNKTNSDLGILTIDGVHLNLKGNQLVADSMFNLLVNE